MLQLTGDCLRRRLPQSIKSWMNDRNKGIEIHGAHFIPANIGQRSSAERPSISVCMAVYNGANFIREQIASILPQLSGNDEIVIVDDASMDGTVAIIEEFRNEHIRIVRQEHNCGIIQTFGHALDEARGEIIFLSDQDDVWHPDKVKKFINMFAVCPDLTLILSDYFTIDTTGNIIATERLKSDNFHPGVLHNLVRNKYQGSTMAFRRCILKYCLPFPSDIPMHDLWIGIVNQFIGKTRFIDEPLIFYRRHSSNSSPQRHAPMLQMTRWRWALIKNTARLYIRSAVLRKRD